MKSVLVLLRDAADQGVPQAACHVGIELLRCARASTALLAAGNAPAAAASESAIREQQLCEDVPVEVTREAWRYMHLAAAGGNLAAMSHFVRDPGLDNTGSTEYADGWAAYERDARQFLDDAIRGGDIRALYHAWTIASGTQPGRGTRLFPRNPDLAIAYSVALRGLLDAQLDRRVTQMTARLTSEAGAERTEAARREGDKLRDLYFAAATPNAKDIDNGATNVDDCWR